MVGVRIAEKLKWVYQERKIPSDRKAFGRAGFTKEALEKDDGKMFQFHVLASYDRRPFTWWARGWEPIWGLRQGESLPRVLIKQGIFDPRAVLSLGVEEIRSRLTKSHFCGHSLDHYGYTDFGRVFFESAQVVSNLHHRVNSAQTEDDVVQIRRQIVNIHGFGPTIAAKIIMYLMREIGLGFVAPASFASVVRPILQEYHNSKIAKEIESLRGRGMVNQVFKALVRLGEPFAIDALYFVDREAPQLKPWLLAE